MAKLWFLNTVTDFSVTKPCMLKTEVPGNTQNATGMCRRLITLHDNYTDYRQRRNSVRRR